MGVNHAKGMTTLKSFSYTYDAAGNRASATSGAGTESYTLDALGRLTSVTYPGGTTESYTYDAHGNRTSKTAGGQTTSYTYDDADQLVSEGSVTYTYDAAGNLTGRGSDSFTWDWRNRLSSATVGGTTTSYAYDGDEVRVRKTQGMTTTGYLWDRESGLPLLVDDGTTGYVHADGVLEQVSGGTPRYLLGDALGSVRGSSDGDGALTGSADYEVFGGVRGTSTTGSVFGFTGEQMDAETGFVFLRARYLDPRTGRFLSRDTVQPNAPGTQGYHVYAYAANNPTTWVDPSGHFLISLALTAVWATAAVFNLAVLAEMAERGMLTACAKDLVCALEAAEAFDVIKMLWHPVVGPVLWSLFRAIPAAMFAFVWVATNPIIFAVLACYEEGRCVEEEQPDDCRAWEKDPENWTIYKELRVHDTLWGVGVPEAEFNNRQQREAIYRLNRERSAAAGGGYVLRSDVSGVRVYTQQENPSAKARRVSIDHYCPRAKPYSGSNASSNACVVTTAENQARGRLKQQWPPPPEFIDGCVNGPHRPSD
jgi:RHS repeat-associated protein